MKVPTDKAILEAIFKHYKTTFARYEEDKNRSSKIYVPIDCKKIASILKTEKDIVFGRLYYHLEHKYSYSRKDGSNVNFFVLKIGNDAKCVNFPLLVSVLANLQEEGRRFWITSIAAFMSLAIALSSLFVSIAALTLKVA